MRRRTLTFTIVAIFLAWNVITYVFILSKQPSKVSKRVFCTVMRKMLFIFFNFLGNFMKLLFFTHVIPK